LNGNSCDSRIEPVVSLLDFERSPLYPPFYASLHFIQKGVDEVRQVLILVPYYK